MDDDEDRAEAAVDVEPAEPVEPDDPRNRDALAIDLIKALGGAAAACQCPACGQVMVKAGGNHEMMCGCEAKPGGQWNTVENALRGDGCGHRFNFRTKEPLGIGRPGHPANDRQWPVAVPRNT